MSAPRRGGFALAWLLVAALLLAQVLGLMHGVVRGPQAHLNLHVHHELASAHALHDHDHSAIAQEEHGGWLASLFSSHGDDSDCRLFDQASQGHAAPVLPMLSLPLVLCTMAFDISRGEALARWAALFDARGPPLTR